MQGINFCISSGGNECKATVPLPESLVLKLLDSPNVKRSDFRPLLKLRR